MPEIRPVTLENWRTLSDLKVREDQSNFVAPNVRSIAEAQFGYDEPGFGHWDFHMRGVYDADRPVGFLMYGYNFPHPKRQAFIIRLMSDKQQQGKGYGRFAMHWMLDLFKSDDRISVVGISYEEQNEVARRLYASLGFIETADRFDEEIIAQLKLRE